MVQTLTQLHKIANNITRIHTRKELWEIFPDKLLSIFDTPPREIYLEENQHWYFAYEGMRGGKDIIVDVFFGGGYHPTVTVREHRVVFTSSDTVDKKISELLGLIDGG